MNIPEPPFIWIPLLVSGTVHHRTFRMEYKHHFHRWKLSPEKVSYRNRSRNQLDKISFQYQSDEKKPDEKFPSGFYSKNWKWFKAFKFSIIVIGEKEIPIGSSYRKAFFDQVRLL